MLAIDWAIGAEKPRVVLNRRFGKLKQARPAIFRRLSIWLKRPEVKKHAQRHGVYWAWLQWRRAAVLMHRGAKAHAAFGMNTGGRPRSQGFTLAEEAAIYALYQLDVGQASNVAEAVSNATTLYQAREIETCEALALADAIGKAGRLKAVKHSEKKRR